MAEITDEEGDGSIDLARNDYNDAEANKEFTLEDEMLAFELEADKEEPTLEEQIAA